MTTTMTLAANLNTSPFEIFNEDCDEVIMLINFYIYLGNSKSKTTTTQATTKNQPNKQQRIRVNDKTATGGWF